MLESNTHVYQVVRLSDNIGDQSILAAILNLDFTVLLLKLFNLKNWNDKLNIMIIS